MVIVDNVYNLWKSRPLWRLFYCIISMYLYLYLMKGRAMYLILTLDKSRCVAIGNKLEEIAESAARVRAIERAKPEARRVAYAGYQCAQDGYMRRLDGELRLIV